MLQKKLIIGFIWNFSDKLFNQLGYFFVTLLIARLIGPKSFGLIGMLSIFILLSESVLQGFSQALIQRSNELTDEDCSTIFYTNLIWALIIYSILYITAPYIAVFYKQPELTTIARILFLGIFINSLMVVFKAQLTIKLDFKSQTIAALYATIVSGILGVTSAYLNYGYWALVILTLSKNFVMLWGLYLYSKWKPSLCFSITSFRGLFKFGSNLMAASILANVVNNLSIILIGRFFSPIQVGYYTQASNISNYASGFITATLQGVTYPAMTAIKKDQEQLVNLYKKLISITMMVTLPLLVGLASVSKEIILLILGEEWISTVPILICLCIARIATPISAINMNILNAVGRSDLFLKIDLLKTPISLMAIFIVLPFGINVLAEAMIVTSFIAFFINAYYPHKFFSFGAIAQLKIARNYIIASAVMVLALHFISTNITFLDLFIKVVLGAVIYGLVLIVLKDSLTIKIFNELVLFTKKVFNK